MIQFNLLPSVKLDYVQARRTKRAVMVVSSLVTVGSLAVLVLLFVGVQVLQKKHSSDLSKDIKTQSSKLEGRQDLNKILTIQNQLNSLSDLHAKKPVTTRLLGFLKKVTPNKVSVASISLDYNLGTIQLTGSADNIVSVNKFVDTLKFTNFKAGDKQDKAFTEVVLSGYGSDSKITTYQLAFKFNPAIFDSTNDVDLQVPAQVTTRSETERPDNKSTEKPQDLFQSLSTSPGAQ